MIELVEKLGYDVETTTKFISEHNEKILYYWSISLYIFLLLVTIIIVYFIFKKTTDTVSCSLLLILITSSSLLLSYKVPDYVFRPMLTEEKQIVQTKYKDVKNKDIDTSKYEIKFSKDKKYLVLNNKGNDIKFTYYPQKDSEGIKQPKDMLHVVDETDKEFLVEVQYFNAPDPTRTEVIKVPKDSFKVTE